MLQVRNIKKTYKTGDLIQVALNDVSLNLRDNEFVAILGPSGSGKTTLLNIIGGLDRYDEGDLIINNVSTKKYKDRDWDAYRNHTIGFVFQSYNLIPHQTILRNVELALTISGVSKAERKKRATKALEEVGLKGQEHKKPNQLSGGQMQRVAIARALVNNPSIVLADEPTGALDSKTSVQVMELLKRVANDRLVVMVTHNGELAEQYANRIVRLQDGQITSDNNPLYLDTKLEKIKHKKLGKAKMGFFTALGLSFNNLLTKKGRTILTAFAGSIGIIGIALILSLSQGFQNYIDKIQEDTLSSYPLTITSETADATSAILSMVSNREEARKNGTGVVTEQQYISSMFSAIGTNDLKSFKKYIEDNYGKIEKDVSSIKYSYSVSPLIYTIDATNSLTKLNPSSMMSSFYSSSSMAMMSSFSGTSVFNEINGDIDEVKEDYEVLAGRWPSNYNELIIVLSEPNTISDLLVYSLGLRDTKELKTMITDIMEGKEVVNSNKPLVLSYDDLLNIKLKLVDAYKLYEYNKDYDVYEDMSSDDEYMKNVYEKSEDLNIVGVMVKKEDASNTTLNTGVLYMNSLTNHVIEQAKNSSIVKKQLSNSEIDVFSGKRFDEENSEEEDKKLDFEDMISVDEDMIKDAFKVNFDMEDGAFDEEEMGATIGEYLADSLSVLTTDTSPASTAISDLLNKHIKGLLNSYIETHTIKDSDPEMVHFVLNDMDDYVDNYIYDSDFGDDFYLIMETYRIPEEFYEQLLEPFTSLLSSSLKSVMINPADPTQYVEERDLPKQMAVSMVDSITEAIMTNAATQGAIETLAKTLTETRMQLVVTTNSTEMISEILKPLTDMFNTDENGESSLFEVDTDKFAKAFSFDMDEDEVSRLMETMMSSTEEKTKRTNLISLGYQDLDDPTSMSLYFKDFESKENFIAFLDQYNDSVNDEDKEISYTDITGLLMSGVRKIIDSVSYVLIAFVSISLVVSSIMIAVITLISVMERTKEIGILRAMGASKKNISSIFNAETFIIGLLSGLIGVGVTILAIPPINLLIHKVADNEEINAVLPTKYAIILVLISVVLTMVAGLIPSRKAAKQDPVIALRSE